MKPEIKAELLRELQLEVATPPADIGIRCEHDRFRPLYRGRPIISFANWDPLNIAQHKELASLVHTEGAVGLASNAARSMGGMSTALERGESRIARFYTADAATAFNTKAQAVLTMVTALCGEGVVVLSTPLSTLPLADACALVGAEFFECGNLENLRNTFEKNSLAKRLIVFIESSSPLTGEPVDISGWLGAASLHGGWAVVDESALFGTSGMRGAGSAESLPSSPALLARMVSFQNVIGSDVCMVAGSTELRELLLKRSRYLRYEAPPAPLAGRFVEAVTDLVELSLSAREMLNAKAAIVHSAVKAQGWKLASESPTLICSLWFESLQKAREVQEAMLQRGILVEALPARGLRRNGAVVRALLSNAHTQEDIDCLLTGFSEVRKRLAPSPL